MQLELEEGDRRGLLEEIRALRDANRLCDVALRSWDGTVLQAHRVVLAAACPALCALVDGNFVEGREGAAQLDASWIYSSIHLSSGWSRGVVPKLQKNAVLVRHLSRLYTDSFGRSCLPRGARRGPRTPEGTSGCQCATVSRETYSSSLRLR